MRGDRPALQRRIAGLEASYAAIAEGSERLRAEFDEHTLAMLSLSFGMKRG
jgi:hypothetical protein